MHNITLVSTEHRESGNCNSDELVKILQFINPEVIFEEETDDDKYFSYYHDPNSFKSLEVKSIIKYKQNHEIKHVPVDAKPNQYLSFDEWDYLFNSFKKYVVYKQIAKEHCALRDKDGFVYLNSEKCTELFVKRKIIESQLIEFSGLNKNELLRISKLFDKEHDHRENTMLRNIYSYSKQNHYNRAVFLLGYAHRKSMMQKIQEHQKIDGLKLNWTFYGV